MNPTEQKQHAAYMKKMNKRIKNAKVKVDNLPPPLVADIYLNEGNLYKDSGRIHEVERQNMELMKKINLVYRTQGKVDCYPPLCFIHRKTGPSDVDIELRERKKYEKEKLGFINYLRNKQDPSQYGEKVLNEDWQKNLKVMIYKSNYPDFYKKKPSWSVCPDGITSDKEKRDRCFFDVKINHFPKPVRLEIELYSDVVPRTADNFVSLCKGDRQLTYKGSPLHRIVSGHFCIGGDIVNFSGTGGNSIYGPTFPSENFHLLHNGPGVVSMYTEEHEANNSQFLITFRKMSILDGKYVVIGRVLDNSLRYLHLIEEYGTKTGKPKCKTVIVDCGVLSSRNRKSVSSRARISVRKQSSVKTSCA